MNKFMLAAALPLASLAQAETVRVDAHDVYYEVHGTLSPDTVPVLMLHGGMMSFEASFAAFLPELLGTHAVIGVEQQGHGHTPVNDNPISMETMRRDTLGVLDALEVKAAHVVGFSAGGMLALDLAVTAPERVASVVAISAASDPDGFVPGMMEMHREPGYQPPPEVLAMMPSEADFARMAEDTAAKNPGGAAAVEAAMQKLTIFIASDWGRPDAEIAAISAPVLVVNGDSDFITPGHALHLFETIPDSQLAILPGTTHLNILEDPGLPAMVSGFIAGAETNRSN